MIIADCFTFLDEIDILECRLEYLASTVNRVVISQSSVTHRGLEWQIILNREHSLVRKFSSEYEFVFVEPVIAGKTHWEREKNQRRALIKGLDDLSPNDLAIVSDVDEIPSIESILAATKIENVHHNFKVRTFYIWANVHNNGFWRHGKISHIKNLKDPQVLRETVLLPDLPSAGAHLSIIGGIETWKRKLAVTPHVEMSDEVVANSKIIDICMNARIYPNLRAAELFRGARLIQLDHNAFFGPLKKIYELKPNWFVSEKSTYKLYEKILIASALGFYRSGKTTEFANKALERLEKHKLSKTLIPETILLVYYVANLPKRIWSVLFRWGKIRSRFKKIFYRRNNIKP